MEWGERQSNGTVIVYNDEGRPPRTETWEKNQGLPPAGTSPPGVTVVGGSVPIVAGATPGTYETKNGPRTIAQMRQELASQGDPRWADENQTDAYTVLGEYTRVSGGTAHPGSGGGGSSAALLKAQQDMMDAIATGNREKFEESKREFDIAQRFTERSTLTNLFGYDPGTGGPGAATGAPNAGAGARIREIYEAIRAKKGAASLPPTDPDLQAAIASEFGVSPTAAQMLLQSGKDYAVAFGGAPPDSLVEGAVNRALPFGQNPSLEARKYLENARQFDQGQYSNMATALLNASLKAGPRDYFANNRMMSGGRDILDQLSGTPAPAFGGQTAEPQRYDVNDTLAKLGLFSRPFNQAQDARRRNPNQGAGAAAF